MATPLSEEQKREIEANKQSAEEKAKGQLTYKGYRGQLGKHADAHNPQQHIATH